MLSTSPPSPLYFPPDPIPHLPPGCSNSELVPPLLRRASSPIPASRRRPSPPRPHENTPHPPANLSIASTRPRALHIVGNVNTERRHGLQQLRLTPLVVSGRASSSL